LLLGENAIVDLMKFIDLEVFQDALKQKGKEIIFSNFDEVEIFLSENTFEVNNKKDNYSNLYDLVKSRSNLFKAYNSNEFFKESEDKLFHNLISLINKKLEEKTNTVSSEIKSKIFNLISNIQSLLKNNKTNLFNCLIVLFSQIAYESGMVKKSFEKNDLIWGTFEFHCNAHLDNLLMIKKNSFKRLLSPLDFDMAYYKQEFIDLKYKNLTGIEDKVGFDDLMLREKNYLLIQLLGINPIPNIDVDVPYFRNVLEALRKENNSNSLKDYVFKYLENLENLLKENISLYYSKGFNECIDTKNFFDEFYEINYMLLELILILEAQI